MQEMFYRYGVSCFVAHKDIHPAAEWILEIETALSTAMHQSRYSTRAYTKATRLIKKSVSLWDVEPLRTQCVRGRTPMASSPAFKRSQRRRAIRVRCCGGVDAILVGRQAKRVQGWPVLSLPQLENAGSFNDAKRLIGSIEKIPHWVNSDSKRLTTAAGDKRADRGRLGRSRTYSGITVIERWNAKGRITAQANPLACLPTQGPHLT
jgi:hypothetical protein